MFNEVTHQPHTAHTTELVPLIYYGKQNIQFTADVGALADIAPTLLSLIQQPIPEEMTGKILYTT